MQVDPWRPGTESNKDRLIPQSGSYSGSPRPDPHASMAAQLRPTINMIEGIKAENWAASSKVGPGAEHWLHLKGGVWPWPRFASAWAWGCRCQSAFQIVLLFSSSFFKEKNSKLNRCNVASYNPASVRGEPADQLFARTPGNTAALPLQWRQLTTKTLPSSEPTSWAGHHWSLLCWPIPREDSACKPTNVRSSIIIPMYPKCSL